MNRLNLIDHPTTHNATRSGTCVGIDFTGKEKDSESGYHYFGARYYDSEVLTGWLSVDPMSDKYPHVSPYNYCEWNPVILKDEDGEGPVLSLAGALVGATVNTALAVYEGKRGTELLAAAAGGAVSGAIYSSNPWAQAAAGAAGEFVEQAINKACGNREEFDGTTIVVAGAAGGVGGKAK